MRVLVTGDEGFIGTHLVNELRGQGYAVHGIDRTYGDLREMGTIEKALDSIEPVDYVVHLAAKVGRLFGEDNPAETVADNAGMTSLIAKACGERNIRLAYASTSEVYGDLGQKMAYERGPMRLPHNVYGLSKRWGEEVAELYAPEGLVVFRLSMPYGPGLPAGRGRAAIVNMIDQAMRRKPIPVHRGAERSWCWVGDTARGLRMILEHASTEHGSAGAWNVGRDDIAVPLRTVAEMACLMTDAPLSLIQDVDPPNRQTVVKRLSTAKLRQIGWAPEVDLAEGMKRTYQWIKDGCPPLKANMTKEM